MAKLSLPDCVLAGACAGVLAAALGGCAGAPREDIAAPTVSPPTDWFCEATDGEWHCVEEDELGPPSVPARGRDRPLQAAPAPEAASASPAVDGPPSRPPATASAAAAAPPQSGAAAGEVPPSAAPADDAPLYRRLAYVPAATTPLTELPGDFYVVQLMALSTRARLERFVRDMGLWGLSAARVGKDDALLYVLLLGVYRNRDDAERAAGALPEALAGVTPWIRPLRSLQAAMLRGDRIAGNSGI